LVTGPTTGATPNLTVSGSDSNAIVRRFAWAIDSTTSTSTNPSLTMYANPSGSTTIGMGVYDPITFADDTELVITTTKTDTQFKDFKDGGDYTYNTWLTIPKNTGNNPKPRFSRGLAVETNFQLNLPTGSNQQVGTAVLDGGSPGTVTVSNSKVTANSIIMLTKQTLTNSHMVAVSSKGAGTFTITSNGNGDTDTVGWFIINNS
jgi:hypothetical protein